MPIVWTNKRVGKCILEKGDSGIHVQRITIKGPVKRTGMRKIMAKGLIMDRRAIWEDAGGGSLLGGGKKRRQRESEREIKEGRNYFPRHE
jgi:hypothetical protein